MGKKASFFIMSNSGTSVLKFSLSNIIIYSLFILTVSALSFVTYFGYDYIQLRKNFKYSGALKRNIVLQSDTITNQNKQIQNFAFEINLLKKELTKLNEFENQVRIIANLEKSKENDSVFGVGGSIPEDIDAKISLEKNHEGITQDIHVMLDSLNTATNFQNDSYDELLKYLNNQRNLLASTPAINPVNNEGYISSKFGYRTSPFTGKKEFHKGLDIANREGSPVYATANGVVAYAGKKGLLGNLVTVNHGHGLVTRYGHLHKILIKRGENVKRGDKIALVGNTGRSTGPHVHYEVRLNKVPVNPQKYILN